MPSVSGLLLDKFDIHIGSHQTFHFASLHMKAIAGDTKFGKRFSEGVLIRAAREERTEGHIPGDTGEAVEKGDIHQWGVQEKAGFPTRKK
jgi:hypothetical protein